MTLNYTHIESAGLSDVGLIRHNNEDVFDSVPERNFFVLADGMGGHNAGEIAALEAVKTLCHQIRNAPSLTTDQWSHYLRDAVDRANERVWQLSLKEPNYSGMGTTLCCFLIHDAHLIYAHIGDSRLYRYRNRLEQLTRDHSLRSALSTSDSPPHPLKNVITRALGTTAHVMADIGILSILPNDLYFLCSDGLTDMVSDLTIETILAAAPSVNEAVQMLINAALKNGGHDNISVLMIKIFSQHATTDLPR